MKIHNTKYIGGDSIKNYINHEQKVKIVDNIIKKNNNWDFFVKYINENFYFQDIDTWNEFLEVSKIVNIHLYDYFLRISSYTNYSFNFDNNILNDLYFIAEYDNNRKDYQQCNENLKTIYGKVRLFSQWITKELNTYNSLDYLINVGMFTIENFWQLYDLRGIQAEKDFVSNEIEKIDLRNFEIPRNIFICKFQV